MRKTKDIISSIAIGVMVGIIIFEVIFALRLYLNRDGDQTIHAEIENGETEVLEFEHFGLVPGESTQYNLYLSTDDGPTKHVTLEFAEAEDSPLADFVRVKVLVNDEEACDELLADLLSGQEITCNADLSSIGELKITIVYYMPDSVGNEAENAEASFNLYITAQFI